MVETVRLKNDVFSYKKVRKHATQLSKEEKDLIREKFKNVERWEIIQHVNNQIQEKEYSILVDDIVQVLNQGEIVEYEQKLYLSNGKVHELVVLKTLRKWNKNRDDDWKPDWLKVVFDITDEKIITLWLNDYDDNHPTLNMGIYNKGLKVGERYWQN